MLTDINKFWLHLVANSPKVLSLFLDLFLNYQLLDLCTPLAWHSGQPFQIICQCTEEEFLTMADAFIKDTLVADDVLQIESLTVVNVSSAARKLFPSDTCLSVRIYLSLSLSLSQSH